MVDGFAVDEDFQSFTTETGRCLLGSYVLAVCYVVGDPVIVKWIDSLFEQALGTYIYLGALGNPRKGLRVCQFSNQVTSLVIRFTRQLIWIVMSTCTRLLKMVSSLSSKMRKITGYCMSFKLIRAGSPFRIGDRALSCLRLRVFSFLKRAIGYCGCPMPDYD